MRAGAEGVWTESKRSARSSGRGGGACGRVDRVVQVHPAGEAAGGEAEIGVAGAGGGVLIGAALLLVALGEGGVLLFRQVALIVVDVVDVLGLVAGEAGRRREIGAPQAEVIIIEDAAQLRRRLLRRQGGAQRREDLRRKFTPFIVDG